MVYTKKKEALLGRGICKGDKMENKEDLLNLNNNKKNPKKFLIYGAAGFLLFVVGVIVFALMGGGSSQNNTVIPPQVKEEPLFKEIPIEQNNTVKTDSVNKTHSETNIQKPKGEENLTKNPTPKKEEKTENNIKNPVPKTLPAVQKNETKIKPQTKKTYTKKVFTKSGKYYIQVAALMKYAKPNKKFLTLIKKHGYNYKIYPVTVNKDGKKIKINKLLIGPFASKKEAKKELVKIKRQITQNAFIFKVK